MIHLFSARNVPHREGYGRSYARMWLSDSSGLHTGRHTSWCATEAHVETSGARPAMRASALVRSAISTQSAPPPACKCSSRRALTFPQVRSAISTQRSSTSHVKGEGSRVCMWNSARRLGRPHWELDTMLHVELRDELKVRLREIA